MKHLIVALFLFTSGINYASNIIIEGKISQDTIKAKQTILKTSTATMPKPKTLPKQGVERVVVNHDLWTNLLQKHVSVNGEVNYKGFMADQSKLSEYISYLSANVPDKGWTQNETLVYWINAYNALTVDLILKNYPVNSIRDIDKPWKQELWTLGNKTYSLDEIEHDIIRKMGEPRIHFALVCAAQSCPKLYNKAFEVATLEEDLTRLTKEFLMDTSKNLITSNKLKISKIFQWFTKDFKTKGSLIDFLNTYTEIDISNKAKITYMEYNWALND